MADLTMLIPTRSRPQNVRNIVSAYYRTGAFDDGAEIVFLIDRDDPTFWQYRDAIEREVLYGDKITHSVSSEWLPMVKKLNAAASFHASLGRDVLGFAGDDHLPRTEHWARDMIEACEVTAIVSCPDGLRPDNLPTHWVMSGDIIRALGRMVPAPVDHLYCDNAVRDLAQCAGIYRWLPDHLVEHMHPLAGKGLADDQYRTVNSPDQYSEDRSRYAIWTYRGMRRDAAIVKALKGAPVGQ